jgi:hypothetical protein
VKSETRRSLLRATARTVAVAAIGALAASLGLRRRSRSEGYCDRAGRCGGCPVTETCDVFRAMGGRARP